MDGIKGNKGFVIQKQREVKGVKLFIFIRFRAKQTVTIIWKVNF